MDSKIKVGVFGLKGFPARGGTAAVGENVIKELCENINFTVYSTSSHASNKNPYNNVRQFIIKKFLPHKLNVFYYNLIGAFHALLFGNYDVIHTHQIDTAYIIPILRIRYKVVATHHGRTYAMSKWGKLMKLFFKATERIMMNCANCVTFVAKSEMDVAQLKYGKDFMTIPNGISIDQDITDVEAEKPYIMFAAGRVVPHKGCHVFLDAMEKINYKGKILIAGDIGQVASYQDQLLDYKNRLDIDFLGMIKDKSVLLGYVKKADLFVFPSFYEAMSMMLLEVASVKTHLICSDIIENTAVFDDSEVIYFTAGDVEELSERLLDFISTTQVSNERVDKAYNKLISMYLWKDIARQYKAVYCDLSVGHTC